MSKAPSEGTNPGKYIYFFIPSVPISKSVLIFLVTVLVAKTCPYRPQAVKKAKNGQANYLVRHIRRQVIKKAKNGQACP